MSSLVEGGDERAIESAHDLVGEFVPLVLKVFDLPPKLWQALHVSKSLLEETGRADECLCLLLEQIVKAPLARDERAP